MKKELEAQKKELKERFSEGIDNYYEEISKKLETRTLRIEDIERIMKEKKIKNPRVCRGYFICGQSPMILAYALSL